MKKLSTLTRLYLRSIKLKLQIRRIFPKKLINRKVKAKLKSNKIDKKWDELYNQYNFIKAISNHSMPNSIEFNQCISTYNNWQRENFAYGYKKVALTQIIQTLQTIDDIPLNILKMLNDMKNHMLSHDKQEY